MFYRHNTRLEPVNSRVGMIRSTRFIHEDLFVKLAQWTRWSSAGFVASARPTVRLCRTKSRSHATPRNRERLTFRTFGENRWRARSCRVMIRRGTLCTTVPQYL